MATHVGDDDVRCPDTREEQSADLMAMAGDALIKGDRLLWQILYKASMEAKRLPERGTEEFSILNDNLGRLFEKALRT